MSYEKLSLEVDNGLATVTLNRPESANAMDIQMSLELMKVSIECDENPAIRAVLMTGAGKMFSAGGDLKSFSAAGDDVPKLVKEMTVYLHGAVSRFSRMDAPVVMAVNGTAAGAGMSLAATGDMVLAGESARFTMAYTAAALSPDGSSTYFLPRLIGMRRTQELMLTNRLLSAQEACDWGLVNRVVPDAQLMDEAILLAQKFAQGPTRAYGAVKTLLAETFTTAFEAQMERESRMIADMMRSRDGREGMDAFLNKRKPNFTGE
ncbi:MAG: enoyl-CoA hydratase [Chromatiales bacterium]|nr:enoyl-CoA hydratase [Chromatiales bacterium]